jgi:hypothetical protein
MFKSFLTYLGVRFNWINLPNANLTNFSGI